MRLEPGTEVGRYRLGELLGRGGVASVYAAEHSTLGTEHALKLLRVDDAESRRRLLDEGRTQARLMHPNVVAVRDAFELEDGRPILIFDRVRGPSLEGLLRQASLEPEAAVQLWTGIVRGVAHAHAHGVVHRDLKPANVLLDATRDPATPRVTDFGIARCLDVPGATQPGRMLGTPGYLAPEQLTGAHSSGPAADVFSLGVMLVELLTGDRPFGAWSAQWPDRVREADGTAPEGLPQELRPLVARCLRLRPEDRFADAGELLLALDGQAEAPVAPAAPVSRWSRALPWGLVGLAVFALGAWAGRAVLGSPTSTSGAAPEQASRAAGLERAAWTRSADHPAEALALLRAAASLRSEDVPDSLVLDLVGRGAAVHVLPMPDAAPAVAMRDGQVAAATTTGEVRIWDVATGRLLHRFATGVYQPRQLELWPGGGGVVLRHHQMMGTSRTEALAWDTDGRAVVYAPGAEERGIVGQSIVARIGEQVVAWDLQGVEIWRRRVPGGHDLHLGAQHVFVRTAQGERPLRVSDGQPGPWLHTGEGALVSVSPSEAAAAALVNGSLVNRLRLPDGELAGSVLVPGTVVNVAWTQEGASLAAWAGRGRRVYLLHDEGTAVLDGHDREGVRAAFFSDGQVVTAAWDGTVRLWGERGQPLHRLGRHSGLVVAMEVDGDRVATGSLDRSVRIWARPDRLLGALRTRQGAGLGGAALAVESAEHGIVVAVPGSVVHWEPAGDRRHSLDLEDARRVAVSAGTRVGVQSDGLARIGTDAGVVDIRTVAHPDRVAVSPGGQSIAIASHGRLELFRADGTPIGGGPLDGYQVALTFSDSGRRLFAGHGEAGHIDVWDVAAGSPVAALRAELPQLRGVSRMAAIGEGVVAGFYGGGVAAWGADGTPAWSQPTESDVVLLVHAEDRVLVGTRDGALQLRTAAGRLLGEARLEEMPTAALLRQDGALIGDARGRLVDWRIGQPPRIRPAHRGPIAHVFRDGGEVWTLGVHGLARAWSEAELAMPVGGLQSTGRLSNLRVCRDSGEVVPVVPFADAGTVWAPEALCPP